MAPNGPLSRLVRVGDVRRTIERLGVGRRALITVAIVVVSAVVGVLSVTHTEYAIIGALAVLAIGLLAVDPVLVAVVAFPSSLIMQRVGGALSVADVVLAGATVVAVILLRGKDLRDLSPLIWAGTAYLAAALPTVVLNPYSANIVEWFHELVLVIGSMYVGYAIGRFGRSQLAVSLYIIACIGLAIAAMAVGAVMFVTEGAFGPVYLPDYQKNTLGAALAMAVVLLYARSSLFTWPTQWSRLAIVILCGGVFASQSRQAMIGALAGAVVISLRKRPQTGRRPRLVWIAAIPVLIFVLTMVNDQLEEDNQFNSANQRLDWYAATFAIWKTSPVFGVGLRWWYTDRFPGGNFQPPNAELEVLSSVGVVGLVGFLAMFVIGFWAMWRIDPAYGTVGAAVIMTRFVQAQFDLYWAAGQASFLWLVAGMCMGAAALSRETVAKSDAALVASLPRLSTPAGKAGKIKRA